VIYSALPFLLDLGADERIQAIINYPCVGDFEFSQYVLRHIVLGHRVDDEVLIAG